MFFFVHSLKSSSVKQCRCDIVLLCCVLSPVIVISYFFLTVLVGSDHNWSHGFQWMHQMAQLTHSVCFPCTEGRFGKDGLVNQLHPTTHHISFLQRRKGKGGVQAKDLDYTSMDHNLRYYFNLIWVPLKRVSHCNSHPGRGDAETERKLRDSPLVNSTFPHMLFSFTTSVTFSCQTTNISRMLWIRWDC